MMRLLAVWPIVVLTLSAAPSAEAAQRSPATFGSGSSGPETAAEPSGFVEEPTVVRRATLFFDRQFTGREVNEGLHPVFDNTIPGAGWLSVGPGYRRWYAHDRVLVDTSAALSWHGYKTGRGSIELPRLARSRVTVGAGIRLDDFTQVDFFGVGPQSLRSDRSQYRIRSLAVGAHVTVRPLRRVGIDAGVGRVSPSILAPGGAFRSHLPDVHDLFPGDLVFHLPSQPVYTYRDVSLTADTRDFKGHPTRGGILRASATQYRDRDTGIFNFTRYEAEASRFMPLSGARLVVGLQGRLVASDTGPGTVVPLYLLPSLGGHNTLRSFPDYRFHDRSTFLLNAEARLAMMTHVDLAVFVDAGNVAPHPGQLDLGRRSYGAGLRAHSRRQTFARLDVARGSEGWRMVFRLTEPLDLTSLSRWTPMPFVP